MAKHHRKHRKLAGLAGLGNISTAGALGRDVLPGLLGIGLTLGGAVAIRSFVRPDPGAMATTYRLAPVIGAGMGLVGAGVVYAATMKRSGAGPAIGVAAASVFAGALAFGIEKLNISRPGAMSAIADVPAALPAPAASTPVTGLGALVAETRRASQLRGVVMEPMRGDFGQTIDAPISGGGMRGSVNPSAFGRPQASVG